MGCPLAEFTVEIPIAVSLQRWFVYHYASPVSVYSIQVLENGSEKPYFCVVIDLCIFSLHIEPPQSTINP